MRSDSIQSIYRNPKFEIKPKLHRYPPKRWGHTAVLNANKLYIYGGKTGKLKEPLYELDCDTFQSHIHEISGFPESRESHSCSLIKGKLLIWGGCRQEKVLHFWRSFGFK